MTRFVAVLALLSLAGCAMPDEDMGSGRIYFKNGGQTDLCTRVFRLAGGLRYRCEQRDGVSVHRVADVAFVKAERP